jgi:hypothetical protein
MTLTCSPLEDQPFGQKVVDNQTHRAAPQSHNPRQVGPRDGLMRPHQIQRDLSVDLSRGPPRRHLKVIGVDFAHKSTFVSHYDKYELHAQASTPPGAAGESPFAQFSV